MEREVLPKLGRLGPRADWLPSTLMALTSFATSVTMFYLTVFFKEQLGFTGLQIGILFAVHAVTGVLVTLPAGLANDRVTSRSLVLIGLLGQALALAGMALVRSFWPFVWVYLGWGLASGLFKLSLDVQVLKTDSGLETGRRLGTYQAARYTGAGAGILLTGLVLDALGFEHHLLLVGGICAGLASLALWLRPTPIARVRWVDYRADLRDRRTLWFALWMLLFASHWGAEATCYGLFLRQGLHLDMDGMGWYMALEFAAVIATLLLTGRRLTDLKRMSAYGVIGMAASGIGHIGMVLECVWASAAFRALHGVGDGLMFLVFYFGIARLFTIERRGGSTGFVTMATMLGYVLGSLAYGPLGERLGYQHPLWISGLVTILLAAGLGWSARGGNLRPAAAQVRAG